MLALLHYNICVFTVVSVSLLREVLVSVQSPTTMKPFQHSDSRKSADCRVPTSCMGNVGDDEHRKTSPHFGYIGKFDVAQIIVRVHMGPK